MAQVNFKEEKKIPIKISYAFPGTKTEETLIFLKKKLLNRTNLMQKKIDIMIFSGFS